MLEFKIWSGETEAYANTKAELFEMMHGLYDEDPAAHGNAPGEQNFQRTIALLLAHPDRGQIVLLAEDHTIQGYALLIPYWSNEFGGTILFVDELFVKPRARNRGIARRFLEHLKLKKPFDAVACALEVSTGNPRARKLYESAGFEPRGYTMMIGRL